MSFALPGLLAASIVALLSEVLAPRAGAPPVMLALALGAIAGNVLPAARRKALGPGLQVFTKKVLKGAIVVLGLKLTADLARDFNGAVFGLIGACLVLSLVTAAALARPFGASPRVSLLLGCGTAICGATAVVTIAPLLDARDDEVAFSIATIFLFNILALFAFPLIGHRLGLTPLEFGAWVGTAVNDTSACVAAGRAFSTDAEVYATAIKLVRTLALVPMAIAVAAYAARKAPEGEASAAGAGKKLSLGEVFPVFVAGFAAVALLANVVALPKEATRPALTLAGWAVTAVLAAVGLNIDAKKIAGAGLRSLGLGFAIAGVMAGASLGLVKVLGVAGR